MQGAVRIESYCQPKEEIASYMPLHCGNSGREMSCRIERTLGTGLIVRLSGINNRTDAENLVGSRLFADRSAFASPGEEEYYHCDLIGLTVVDRSDRCVGKICDVANYGAGDLLEIISPPGKTWLVPLDRNHVPTIDVGAGRVVVAEPEAFQ